VARPWFDKLTLTFLGQWFFPLSRLWAAARAANGSVERFFEEVPITPAHGLDAKIHSALMKFEHARGVASATEKQWEPAFFANKGVGQEDLVALEIERLKNRASYNETRRHFAFLRRHDGVPAVRWEISTPVELANEYARVLRAPTELFAPPDPMPEVSVSRKIPTASGTDYWLRFQSPSQRMGDEVVARVHEPRGVVNPATVVFLHGICVEFDHWHGMIDEVSEFCRMGIRVVRPEAPWHGRRVPPGRYGGERFIGSMPLGSLEFFSAQVREASVLLDWCRRNTDGPVALGGSSLGAHVARATASWAGNWPRHLHPDALFLVTPCGRLEDAAVEGSFARVWGTAEAASAHGWAPELRSKWLALIDPPVSPVVPPERIVAVLGNQDSVTPFASGKLLIEDLGLPEENIFIWEQGHFTIPLRLVRNKLPLRRFHSVLNGAR